MDPGRLFLKRQDGGRSRTGSRPASRPLVSPVASSRLSASGPGSPESMRIRKRSSWLSGSGKVPTGQWDFAGQDEKRALQRPGHPFTRDLKLLHGFQKRALRLGRGPVDFIRQQDLGENRPGWNTNDWFFCSKTDTPRMSPGSSRW
jgi:hypothetical protein